MKQSLLTILLMFCTTLSYADGTGYEDSFSGYSFTDYSSGYQSMDLDAEQNTIYISNTDLNSIAWDTAALLSVFSVDSAVEDDKSLHYIAGVAVGRLAAAYCDSRDFNSRLSRERINFLCSLGAATLAGILKEVYDSTGRGDVDIYDALATSAGGAFVSLRFVF